MSLQGVPVEIRLATLKATYGNNPANWDSSTWNIVLSSYIDVFVEYDVIQNAIPGNAIMEL